MWLHFYWELQIFVAISNENKFTQLKLKKYFPLLSCL